MSGGEVDVARLKAWLREAWNNNADNRDLARKTRDYYYGDQLDEETIEIVDSRGQPVQWENNLRKMGEKVLSFRQNHRGEIKMVGRQDADRAGARLLTDVLRFISEQSDYEATADASDEALMIEGVAVHEIYVEEDPREVDRFGRTAKDVKIRHVPYEALGLDPFARALDYSDARYIHQFYWVDREDLYRHFPREKVDALQNGNFTSQVTLDEESDDMSGRDRVPLVYTWYRLYDRKAGRDRYYYAFWSDETVLQQAESPYDFDGFPMVVAFVHRHRNAHFGIFKDILPLQDAINFARLRLHNMLGSVKILVGQNAVDDVWQFAIDYAADDSVTEVRDINQIKEIKQHADIQQLIATIMDNRQQIKEIIGANDEFLAMANNRLSGEAIGKRLDIGSMGIGRFIKASMRLQRRTFEIAAKMVQQYYDSERVLQIVDPEEGVRVFTVNETMTDERGFPVMEVDGGRVRPVARHDFRFGKYDLIFTHAVKPSTPSAERMRQITELVKVLQVTDPDLVKYLVPDLLKAMDATAAERLRRVVERKEAAQAERGPDRAQLAAMQAQLAEAQAKIAKMQSEAQLNVAKAKSLETKAQLDLTGLWAKTAIERQKNAARLTRAVGDTASGRFR